MPTTWHQRREQEEPLLAAMDATTNTNHACQVDHMFFLIEQQQHNFPASSELDGALRLPWRGGFGSGIQTTSSISGGRGPAAGAARLGGVLRELRWRIEAVRGGSRHMRRRAAGSLLPWPDPAWRRARRRPEWRRAALGGERGGQRCWSSLVWVAFFLHCA